MRRLRASGPGRFLVHFLPLLALVAVLAAIQGDWGVVALAVGVAAGLVAWASRASDGGASDVAPSRAETATTFGVGLLVFVALVLAFGGGPGAWVPVAMFAAFAVVAVIRAPGRR